ncbi:MAG: tRNA (adenosine(37)-N6)-dimethylallyltransferase MiaA [Campylobacterales bacterium]|nr:tRNA (adenosine(37)-N6)-dimethylallyltransferase MiaA [Campylobacterales bacterium]
MKQIALIGPTASGKSDLALKLAHEHNAYILSLDSLAIYQEIDISSAKPSADELSLVKHYGIDLIRPDEPFSVATFEKLYRELKARCLSEKKNLIIVGGSSFYLRTLLQGLSPIPEYSEATQHRVEELLTDLPSAHRLLLDADPLYMKAIETSDRYRIEKMLLLYVQTAMTPTEYFTKHPPEPIIEELRVFEIDVERDKLRKRIHERTLKMIESGLIDEVCDLEYRYTRSPNALKAIGIIEVFDYLDGRIGIEEMREQIITHTAQLAKRQQTFNRTQFPKRELFSAEEIYKKAKALFS